MPKTEDAAPDPAGAQAYQLEVTLRGITPPIWRRVLVPLETTLPDLHQIVQVLFGWDDTHLHEFEFSDGRGETWVPPGKTLARKGVAPGTTFRYLYDFGAEWVHEIVVEEIVRAPAGPGLPVCTAGKRAAPPEDCGNYDDFLAALADPEHEDHERMVEWIGGRWDPEAFDLDDVNEGLDPVREKLARRAAKAARTPARRKNHAARVGRKSVRARGGAAKSRRRSRSSPAEKILVQVAPFVEGANDAAGAAIALTFGFDWAFQLVSLMHTLVPFAITSGAAGRDDVALHYPASNNLDKLIRENLHAPNLPWTEEQIMANVHELTSGLRPLAPDVQMVVVFHLETDGRSERQVVVANYEQRDGLRFAMAAPVESGPAGESLGNLESYPVLLLPSLFKGL